MKVLYHIDESSRWNMLLGNVSNMLRYGKEASVSFEIEILANGPAVLDLQPDKAGEHGISELLTAVAPAVRICACNNALHANGILPQSLFSFIQVVPAGVVELATRQEEGYSYIKP